MAKCVICGKEVPPPRIIYCSDKCATAREGKRRQSADVTRKLGSVDTCARCGRHYTVTGPRQRYCSECKTIRCIIDHEKCLNCGKPYTAPATHRFCSKGCMLEHRNRLLKENYAKRIMPPKVASMVSEEQIARKKKGITRRELAVLVGYTDRKYLDRNIYAIERLGRPVPKKKVKAFSDVLGIPIEQLRENNKREP